MRDGTEIIATARHWIGTPYCHGASIQGVGCDCLGLIRGLYCDFFGGLPGTLPPYGTDWAEASRADLLAHGLQTYLEQKPIADAEVGDILLFRLKPDGFARHAAILSSPDQMIHAWERSPVCEVSLGRFWRKRLVDVFSFPEKG
ncbi:MAG: C40 family peptidase [Rhizobiales bacterium]|nr:C40 family peptidase [Hyphomicrobiales bacterium]